VEGPHVVDKSAVAGGSCERSTEPVALQSSSEEYATTELHEQGRSAKFQDRHRRGRVLEAAAKMEVEMKAVEVVAHNTKLSAEQSSTAFDVYIKVP
jgi:predicted ATPase